MRVLSRSPRDGVLRGDSSAQRHVDDSDRKRRVTLPSLDVHHASLPAIEAKTKLIGVRPISLELDISSGRQPSEMQSKRTDDLLLPTRIRLPSQLEIRRVIRHPYLPVIVLLAVVAQHPPAHRCAGRHSIDSLDESADGMEGELVFRHVRVAKR